MGDGGRWGWMEVVGEVVSGYWGVKGKSGVSRVSVRGGEVLVVVVVGDVLCWGAGAWPVVVVVVMHGW